MNFKEWGSTFWIAAMFSAGLVAVILLSNHYQVASASTPAGQRPPLVLQPRASLKPEMGAWSFAPDVPSPSTRKEQRRVIVNWEMRESQAEIAPGVLYDDYWGFEGRVPGPLLRVREGDLVEIHLKNNIRSLRQHNIDFHFVSGPGGGAAALNVAPGETAVLEARAMAPGFYMFHCATPDIPMHIANGMYGFVLVEPAEGLPAVDKEWYVVQSEIYTRDGEKGHQTFSMERGDRGDAQYVVFNGAVGSLLGDKALQAALNQSIRMFVGNAGPNYVSSFHVIGEIFDKVYREGDLLSPPARGLQTTLIPAGGSAVVEFTARVPGTFLLVDHSIFRLHRGAAGSVVVSGEKMAEIFEPISAPAGEMSAESHLAPPPSPDSTSSAHMHGGIPPASSVSNPPGAHTAANGSVTAANQLPPNTIKVLPGAGTFDNDPSNDYFPKVLVVKPGTTVTWWNADGVALHDVMAEKGQFRSVLLKPYESWSYTFTKPGIYPFTCAPHPWMKGKVVVR